LLNDMIKWNKADRINCTTTIR